jgi:hypothetical protein
MRDFKLIAAFAVAAGLTTGAQAGQGEREVSAADFPACDGYGAPGRSSDGISRGVSGFTALMVGGTESSQLRRSELVYGRRGIDICTALLDYRWMLPEYGLRRASLLEARGLHRLGAGDPPAALADFDLAREAAGAGDALTDRSFLLGLRLARAYAQYKAGDMASAAAESQAVIAARPYDSRLAETAAQLQFSAARDWPAYLRNLREIARIDPNVISRLYTLAFIRGEFGEVIALHPQVRFGTPPAPGGGYVIPGRDEAIAETAVRQATVDGFHAYALQANGRNTEADAALAAAGARLAQAMLQPPLETGRTELTRAQRSQFAAMLARRPEAVAAIAKWERMIRLRRQVAEGNIAAAIADMQAKPVDPDSAALDLFEAMIRAQPALGAEMSVMVVRLRARIATDLDRALDLSVQELARRLPEPESVQRMPSYDGGAGALDGNGYRSLPGTDGAGTQTIRFASGRGSISVANEMALLRAADLARQAGRRGLIVLRRGDVVRSTTITTYYGGSGPATPSGQEAEIEIAFVDPAALPPAYTGAGWRVLDPEIIWSALSPIYVRQSPTR